MPNKDKRFKTRQRGNVKKVFIQKKDNRVQHGIETNSLNKGNTSQTEAVRYSNENPTQKQVDDTEREEDNL